MARSRKSRSPRKSRKSRSRKSRKSRSRKSRSRKSRKSRSRKSRSRKSRSRKSRSRKSRSRKSRSRKSRSRKSRSRRPKSGIKGGIPVLNCRVKRSPTDSKQDLIKEIRAYVNCWEKSTGRNQDLSLERLRGETVSQLKNHLKWYRNN